MLPFVFEDGFGYERYLDYALDVPMYFVFRDGHYIDVAGQSFRDFLDGRLPGLPGEKPRVSDFTDHLSTIFPEVRLKSLPRDARRRRRPLEPDLRPARALGRPALRRRRARRRLGRGQGLDASTSASALRDAVPKLGLEAQTPGGETLRELGKRILAIAEAGPQRARPAQRRGRQ